MEFNVHEKNLSVTIRHLFTIRYDTVDLRALKSSKADGMASLI